MCKVGSKNDDYIIKIKTTMYFCLCKTVLYGHIHIMV